MRDEGEGEREREGGKEVINRQLLTHARLEIQFL